MPNPKIQAFWNDYKSANNIGHDEFTVAEFGDSPDLANRLADLIKRGIKTATCSAYQEYLDAGQALPQVGALFMVTLWDGDPVCACAVTEIRIGSFNTADAAFAYDEGEDDRTLESWTREHRRFFGMSSADPWLEQENFLLVFERFRLLWPKI